MTVSTFPVTLACCRCGEQLSPHTSCSCPARTRFEYYHGIPRTHFAEDYWGECPRETLTRVLDLLDTTHWSEALRQEASQVHDHLTGPIGPDFLYGLPWEKIRTVLDLGAGLGFLAAPMAAFAEQVVALEPVPERARFLARRARQDGLHNLHSIIGRATALPFAPSSFDLITLNGVYQYLGLRDGRDGEGLRGLLAGLFRLLKPNGHLYLGIETRYALAWWFRRRDPGADSEASCLPGFLADWYRIARRVPFYGPPPGPARDRVSCHTPGRYEQLLREAGFETVEVHGCFRGYHEQAAVYPLKAYEARRVTRRIVEHSPRGWARLRRVVAEFRPLYDQLEEEVILLARKGPGGGPVAQFSGVRPDKVLTQFSTDDKVFALTFAGGRPLTIAKAGKTEEAARRLRNEAAFLAWAERRQGTDLGVALRGPRGKRRQNGLTFHEYEYSAGRGLHQFLLPASLDVPAFTRAFSRACEGYVDLCLRLSAAAPADLTADICSANRMLDDLGAVGLEDRDLKRKIQEASREVKGRSWAVEWAHGDLALVNVLVPDQGQLVLIDWEHVSGGLPSLDLMTLLYDTWARTRRLPARLRQTIMDAARRAVGGALGRLGRQAEDFPLIELLLVARQCRFWFGSARADIGTLLRDYRAGAFTIPAGD